MCYEFWRHERMLFEEEEAKRRAQKLIDKAKSAAPKDAEPAPVEPEKEPVPA